jgi:hypothetical protein
MNSLSPESGTSLEILFASSTTLEDITFASELAPVAV